MRVELTGPWAAYSFVGDIGGAEDEENGEGDLP
jgi:hypothetical protein